MNKFTRIRLEKVVDYHQAVVDYHKPLHEEWLKSRANRRAAERQAVEDKKSDLAESGERIPKNIKVEEEDLTTPYSALIDLHTEVVRQLREVLDSEPRTKAIEEARTTWPIKRDTRSPVRPVSPVITRH